MMFVLKNAAGTVPPIIMPVLSIEIPDSWGVTPLPSGGSYVNIGGWHRSDTTPAYTTPQEMPQTSMLLGSISVSMQVLSGGVCTFNSAYVDGVQVAAAQAGFGAAGIIGIQGTLNGTEYVGLGVPVDNMFTLIYFLVSSDAAGDPTGSDDQGGPITPPDGSGGWGDYDFSSDNVQGSPLPESSSLPISPDGHGLHAYRIDDIAYSIIGRALWGDGDYSDGIAVAGDLWQRWQNFKFNPTAGLLSCIRLPWCFMPNSIADDTNVKIAGTYIGTGGTFGSIPGCKPVTCTPVHFRALETAVPEKFGSWLDYDGGCDITLVLPFCGRISVDPSACVNGRIWVDYRCDPATGNLAAYIYTQDRWGNSQLYQQCTGNCAMQVPLVGHDDGQIAMLGTMVGDAVGIAGSLAAGNAAGVLSGTLRASQSLLNRRESTQVVGGYAGSVSFIANTQPYLLISYAHPTKSAYYRQTQGRPSEYAADGSRIGDYTGYTAFNHVDIEISHATAEECEEIRQLLMNGVIL